MAAFLVSGCATTSKQTESDPVAAAEAAWKAGRSDEARRQLLALERPDGRSKVLLGDVCREQGLQEQAVAAYWDARSDADPDVRARANCGLGEVALQREDLYLAADRFESARKDAVADATKDRVTVGRARLALARGDVAGAVALRAEVRGPIGGNDVVLLDAALRAAAPPEPAPVQPTVEKPAPKIEPAPRRVLVKAPAILARTRWSARPIRRSGSPEPMGSITRVTLHHTASKRLPGTSYAANAKMMRNLQSDHQNGRGWADLGYHYVIDRQGRIWQGREVRWQGAHAGNGEANRNNVGISLVGDFDRYVPSPSQKRSLKALVRWLCSAHDVRPSRIAGHHQVLKAFTGGGTACPGHHLSAYIAELRRAVTADRRKTSRP